MRADFQIYRCVSAVFELAPQSSKGMMFNEGMYWPIELRVSLIGNPKQGPFQPIRLRSSSPFDLPCASTKADLRQ